MVEKLGRQTAGYKSCRTVNGGMIAVPIIDVLCMADEFLERPYGLGADRRPDDDEFSTAAVASAIGRSASFCLWSRQRFREHGVKAFAIAPRTHKFDAYLVEAGVEQTAGPEGAFCIRNAGKAIDSAFPSGLTRRTNLGMKQTFPGRL